MAKQDKPQQDPPAEEGAAPKKKRGKLVLIAGVLVLLAGGGGAAWYFMRPADTHAPQAAEKPNPAIFLPLESFTVNLLPTDGQMQFIQAGLTLKLEDSAAADLIKERMPQVRDRVLIVLSSKRSAELLHTQGKQKLAAEISEAIRSVAAPTAKHAPAPGPAHAAAEVSPVGSAQAADKPAAAGDKPTEAKPAHTGPAIEVLFTAFIIQ